MKQQIKVKQVWGGGLVFYEVDGRAFSDDVGKLTRVTLFAMLLSQHEEIKRLQIDLVKCYERLPPEHRPQRDRR